MFEYVGKAGTLAVKSVHLMADVLQIWMIMRAKVLARRSFHARKCPDVCFLARITASVLSFQKKEEFLVLRCTSAHEET